jgi:FkbM family methyltransferase
MLFTKKLKEFFYINLKNNPIIVQDFKYTQEFFQYSEILALQVLISQIKGIKRLCSEYGLYKGLKIWKFYKYVRIKKRNLDLTNKTVRVNGYNLSLLPNDDGISTELALFNTHEPLNTKLLAKNLKKGMVCFDIGANIGYYTLLESKIVGDEGKVIAIEPSPVNFAQLQKSIQNENANNVELYQMAGGDQNGTIKFLLNSHSNLSRIILNEEKSNPEGIIVDVPVKKLDSFLDEFSIKKLDFIRMDVEGYEFNILEGMRNSIKKFRPMIQMEVHTFILGNKKTQNLLEWLMAEKYEINYFITRQLDCPTVGNMDDVKHHSFNNLLDLLSKNKLPSAFLLFLKPQF